MLHFIWFRFHIEITYNVDKLEMDAIHLTLLYRQHQSSDTDNIVNETLLVLIILI